MTTGFVIGNGESRKGIDLNLLKPYGPIFGCNALYRDFVPDALITVDEQMIKIIEEDNVASKCEVIKRVVKDNNDKIFESSRGVTIPDKYHGAAGPSALYIMCDRLLNLKQVYLVGFDITSKTGRVNNMYKNTRGYVSESAPATYTGNWIEKLGRIFLAYPHIIFKYTGDVVSRWNAIPNLIYTTYDMMFYVLKKEYRG